MASRLKLLGITNSLRPGSLNRMVLELSREVLAPGVQMDVFDLRGLPVYEYELEQEGIPAPVRQLAEAVGTSDGVVLASPEYNHSIPPAIKNAIDWLSRVKSEPLKDKPFCIVSATPGMLGGARVQYEIRRVLDAVGSRPLVRPEVFIGFAPQKFDAQGKCIDERTRQSVTNQQAAFVEWVCRCKLMDTRRSTGRSDEP